MKHTVFSLFFLAGCLEAQGTASLTIQASARDSENADGSSIELTVTSDKGSETRTVSLGQASTFKVGAGEVSVDATGSWYIKGGDTSGEGWSCEGSQELSLDTDERKMIVLTLDCDMAYID